MTESTFIREVLVPVQPDRESEALTFAVMLAQFNPEIIPIFGVSDEETKQGVETALKEAYDNGLEDALRVVVRIHIEH